eukprot:Sspe_Gene.69546::Locus_41001_Transcript_1_1_Confidence_1.000_Length_2256::g.69546::m.69546
MQNTVDMHPSIPRLAALEAMCASIKGQVSAAAEERGMREDLEGKVAAAHLSISDTDRRVQHYSEVLGSVQEAVSRRCLQVEERFTELADQFESLRTSGMSDVYSAIDAAKGEAGKAISVLEKHEHSLASLRSEAASHVEMVSGMRDVVASLAQEHEKTRGQVGSLEQSVASSLSTVDAVKREMSNEMATVRSRLEQRVAEVVARQDRVEECRESDRESSKREHEKMDKGFTELRNGLRSLRTDHRELQESMASINRTVQEDTLRQKEDLLEELGAMRREMCTKVDLGEQRRRTNDSIQNVKETVASIEDRVMEAVATAAESSRSTLHKRVTMVEEALQQTRSNLGGELRGVRGMIEAVQSELGGRVAELDNVEQDRRRSAAEAERQMRDMVRRQEAVEIRQRETGTVVEKVQDKLREVEDKADGRERGLRDDMRALEGVLRGEVQAGVDQLKDPLRDLEQRIHDERERLERKIAVRLDKEAFTIMLQPVKDDVVALRRHVEEEVVRLQRSIPSSDELRKAKESLTKMTRLSEEVEGRATLKQVEEMVRPLKDGYARHATEIRDVEGKANRALQQVEALIDQCAALRRDVETKGGKSDLADVASAVEDVRKRLNDLGKLRTQLDDSRRRLDSVNGMVQAYVEKMGKATEDMDGLRKQMKDQTVEYINTGEAYSSLQEEVGKHRRIVTGLEGYTLRNSEDLKHLETDVRRIIFTLEKKGMNLENLPLTPHRSPMTPLGI